jgi:hypothetical protein
MAMPIAMDGGGNGIVSVVGDYRDAMVRVIRPLHGRSDLLIVKWR